MPLPSQNEIRIVTNHPRRLRLTFAILCALVVTVAAHAQSPDEPSLGDVARSHRQNPAAAAVIDEDEMARRGFNQGAGNADIDCDADCEAKVKLNAIQAGRLQVTDAQWQTAYASGKAAFAKDTELLSLIDEWKQQTCQRTARTDPQKARDLDQRFTKKITEDVYGDGTIADAIQSGDTPVVDAARAKVVKVQLMRYMMMRDMSACFTSSSTSKPPAK